MATLYKNQWPAGWTPNSSDLGNPNGLLRMNNLTFEEDGSLSLVRGTKKISSGSFTTAPSQIWGRTLDLARISGGAAGYVNGSKVRYIVDGTSVLRNYSAALKSETAFDEVVISGGGTVGVAFGFAYGHTFICSGSKRIIDNGITQRTLDPYQSVAPVVAQNPPVIIDVGKDISGNYSLWDVVENNDTYVNSSTYVLVDVNLDNFRGAVIYGQSSIVNLDTMKFGGIAGTGRDDDTFKLNVRIGDTALFVKTRVEILLDTPSASSSTISDSTDYYWYEWDIASGVYKLGLDEWSTLSCARKDFVREGVDGSLNWTNVRGVKVVFVCTGDQELVLNDLSFQGGIFGPLDGDYTYKQVNVNNTGDFVLKGIPSNASNSVYIKNASIEVATTTADANANEIWIYRQGGTLDDYYLVKKFTGAYGFSPGNFDDFLSDADALLQNERIDNYLTALPDDIIGMETNFKNRNWYLTYEDLYPSYQSNYGAYDSRYRLEIAGRDSEFAYFITKLSTDVMVVATNLDFYEISGTGGLINIDGIELFDINVRSLGIKSPTISKSFVVREGKLFYIAADGVRVLEGSNAYLLSDAIGSLFDKKTRYGIPAIKITTNLADIYQLGIAKNKLIVSVPHTDNTRAAYVYDFTKKYWRYENFGDSDSIQALFVEEDDTIIYSTASFGDKWLRIRDVGTLYDEASNISFSMLTVFDFNNQPRNRKDSYTFKITADTGNQPITITVRGYDGSSTLKTQSFTPQFNGKSESFNTIFTNIGLVKAYQIEITGTVPACKIYDFSIDYDPRPEQLTNLRLLPTQFGIAGRKRIPEIPLIIDTLGNEITFTPIIDGFAKTAVNITTTSKSLYTYHFTTDQSGFDIGGLLSGTLFEFYELVNPREIELLPDPVRYKHIPYSNLGTASRKRFIQYAFIIDTRGSNVTFTPYIDGTVFSSQTINTNRRQTVIYVFASQAIGIDIHGTLSGAVPFEFYGINESESISEKLPPKTKYLQIPCTNFGIAAKKKIRTIPLVLDTAGGVVTFTPTVDGTAFPISQFQTNGKSTVLHYFQEFFGGIPFGIDYCGVLSSSTEFEFYEMLKPENVETIPVGKKYDQIGPVVFEKIGKIRELTVHMIATGTSVNYKVYSQESIIFSGTLATVPNVESNYIINLPKGVNPNIFKLELSSASVFHRFDIKIKVLIEGAQTSHKRITIK